MNFKRIGRILVCLILVCALIISISPIKAHATAAGSVALVEGLQAVASILIGLGVLPGEDRAVYDSLCTDVADHLSSLGFIADGFFEAWKLVNGLKVNYYVVQDVVKEARSYLFDRLTIYYSSSEKSVALGAGHSIQVGSSASYTTTGYCEVFCAQNKYSGYGNFLFLSQAPFSVNGIASTPYGSLHHYVFFTKVAYDIWKGAGNYIYSYSPYGAYSAESFANSCSSSYHGKTLAVSSGLTAGEIADEELSFADGYSTWASGVITVPGTQVGDSTDDIPYVPIGIGPSYEDTTTKTQEDVWAGASTVPETGTDTETDTGSGAISGTVTLPGWVQDGFNNLLQGLKDIINTLLSLPAALWAALPVWLTEGVSNMATGLRDILDSIKALPGAIAEAMADVITGALTKAFAISDTFVATKVEALTLKYPYLDTFLALGADLKAFFLGLGTTPPLIYINLGASEGSYNIGGQEVFMDLSWYARYKPTMDAVIGGFIWLWLAWRIYLSIPGIISGASGVWGSITRHSERSMKNNSKENAE